MDNYKSKPYDDIATHIPKSKSLILESNHKINRLTSNKNSRNDIDFISPVKNLHPIGIDSTTTHSDKKTDTITSPNSMKKGIHIAIAEAEKKIQGKKRVRELNQLSRERDRLKKTLLLIKDPKSLEILSQKITEINSRISRLMREINGGNVIPKKTHKLIRENSNLKTLEDINFSSMKEDMKKIDNHLKVNELNHAFNLLEITNVDGVIKDKPSFLFQRSKKLSLYEPSTEFGINKNSGNRKTLNTKSMKLFGFRQIKNEVMPIDVHSTFEDVFFEASENQKLKEKEKKHIKVKSLDSNDEFFCLSSARPKTLTTLNKRPQTERNLRNEKFIDKMVEKIVNNTKIIKDTIKLRINEERKAFIKANKPSFEKLRKKFFGFDCKEYLKKAKKRLLLSDEENYVNKLENFPKSVRVHYREVYKKLLTEDRLLNKPDPRIENHFDLKYTYIKEQKEFQKETYKVMYLLGENCENGKEDDIFKDKKVFNDFENMETLKWLVKKKDVLKKTKKWVGAFNPKEKLNLYINYP